MREYMVLGAELRKEEARYGLSRSRCTWATGERPAL